MLLKQLIDIGIETISQLYPEREAREMVFVLLEHQVGTKRHTHIVEPGYEVSDDDASAAMAAFCRMVSGEPLQYVTGVADFYGRQFHVTPDVLIPRPETELLCRIALDSRKGTSVFNPDNAGILDLCTGSGCIAWTLALEMPGAEVTAVDISDAALAVASGQDFAEEMARTGACAPKFLKADVLSHPELFLCPPERSEGSFAPKYDILVSNPPYVMDKEKALMRKNVLEHEPHLALFVSDEDPLLFYRAVSRWAKKLLKQGGLGIVEINEALGPQTAEVFRSDGFSHTEILKDLSDRDRFVLFKAEN